VVDRDYATLFSTGTLGVSALVVVIDVDPENAGTQLFAIQIGPRPAPWRQLQCDPLMQSSIKSVDAERRRKSVVAERRRFDSGSGTNGRDCDNLDAREVG